MKINRSTTRRSFLKNTLWTAGGLAFPAIVRADVLGLNNRISASSKLNIGSIGLGKMGHSDLNLILGCSEVRVTSLCDVETKRLQWGVDKVNNRYQNSECKSFSDWRQLLAQPDLDGVIISTQDHWHGVIATAACKAGKAVYLQKPIALTHYEGQQIVAAAKRYNTVLQVGSQQRSEASFHTGCELVRNGYFGALKSVRLTLTNSVTPLNSFEPEPIPPTLDWEMWLGPAPWRPYSSQLCPIKDKEADMPFPNWRGTREMANGGLGDFSPHNADIAQWGSNHDHSGPVQFIPPNSKEKRGLKFVYSNGIEMECGSYEFVEEGTNAPADSIPMVRFDCEAGWVLTGRGDLLMASDPELLRRGLNAEDIRLFRARNHYQAWVDAIRNSHPTIASVEMGHRSASFGWLGNICIELNRPLQWDPLAEQFVNDPEANARLRRPLRAPWVLG